MAPRVKINPRRGRDPFDDGARSHTFSGDDKPRRKVRSRKLRFVSCDWIKGVIVVTIDDQRYEYLYLASKGIGAVEAVVRGLIKSQNDERGIQYLEATAYRQYGPIDERGLIHG
jgi:hypothetical protein